MVTSAEEFIENVDTILGGCEHRPSAREQLYNFVHRNINAQRRLNVEDDDSKWFEYMQPVINEFLVVRARMSEKYYFLFLSCEREVRAQLIVNYLTSKGLCAHYEYDDRKRIYCVYINLAIEMALVQ